MSDPELHAAERDDCCSSFVESLDTPFDPEWLGWVLREAESRGIPTVCVMARADGWVPVDPSEVLFDPIEADWRVSQRQGCRGVSTRVLGRSSSGIVALLQDRRSGHPEDPRWRSLLVEAMVLAHERAPRTPRSSLSSRL